MQKLLLSIPEPCHENWQHMTPTGQGRFCNACAKEVVDFSMMTDTEVLNYFTTLTHDKVCGRALPSQLERTISRPKEPKKRLFWYWNYIVMCFMFFGKGNSAKAQGSVKPVVAFVLNVNDKVVTFAGYAVRRTTKTINGKVTDINGNPVSFATVKIKGKPAGISADANGGYSIKANSNAILVISGAGFKEAEVVVGSQSFINTVMEKGGIDIKEVVVTVAGGVMRRPARKAMIESKDTTARTIKATIIFEVKEDKTGIPIDKAAITITKKGDNLSEKSFSDKKGIYEFKQIKLTDSYFVKIEAEGYETNEFTMEATDIKDRKKAWEVLLRKKKTQIIKSTSIGNAGSQNMVRLGQVSTLEVGAGALYVVDGITNPKTSVDITPDDIENITILQSAEAKALFGIEGANGAIVITTRKSKEIKMKEVVVNSDYGSGCRRTTRGGISYTNTYEDSFLGDTIATVKTLLTNSIKVYPNPVQRNTGFSVALKLKQAGNYSVQVTDASGRILLQQRFYTTSKNHTEKIVSDSRWAGGVYYIRVFDAQNKLISKSSFIIQ